MLKHKQQAYNPDRSVRRYIRSIALLYGILVIVMTSLIGATYWTITVALDRHALQREISSSTSHQFIRFQQLVKHTRAVMRASSAPSLPDNVIASIVEEVKSGIAEIRTLSARLQTLQNNIDDNLLERLNPRAQSVTEVYEDLEDKLEEFLLHVERVVFASTEVRRQRYQFWGAIDFAASSDSLLMRAFDNVVAHNNQRARESIALAQSVSTFLLFLLAALVMAVSLVLFLPLLLKLRQENRNSIDFKAKLEQLSQMDSLTNLYNSRLFNSLLQELFERLQQEKIGFSLLLIDLDHFKGINDRFGHQCGDAALVHGARILQSAFRTDDIVARIGGDEFAVLLPNIHEASALEATAKRVLEAMGTEFSFDGHFFNLSCSVGGALVPDQAQDEKSLIRVADRALLLAKKKRNAVVIFDQEELVERRKQEDLVAGLQYAAKRNEYLVHYQPKVDLSTGEYRGMEALVRWQHPQLGLLYPGRFLPLMNAYEQIKDMTQAVLHTVGRDLRMWKDRGLVGGPVAINLPEVLLVNDEGYQLFAEVIKRYDLQWQDFSVEVTEDVFINRNTNALLATIRLFREHGADISLDDFGTGFASLLHLKDFPFDEMKIDRSFISNILSDERSEQIVRAMINLSSSLGKRCVAEGIETAAQHRFLQEIGCDTAQGFYYARPVPAKSISDLLRKNRIKGMAELCTSLTGLKHANKAVEV